MPDPFQPSEYFQVAQELAAHAPSEAHLRAAVSRAYYAIFLIARDKAHLVGKERLHQMTKAAIQARSFAAGGEYESLRQLLVQADYLLFPDDPAYEDWTTNWRDADYYATSLLDFLSKW
jgi:hypothetical protein